MLDPAAVALELERSVSDALAARAYAQAATLALKGYGPSVYAYLRAVLRDEDLADESFSRFAEKLWRSIADFRGESSFATWSFRLAWYATKELKRELARKRERPASTGELSQLVLAVRESTASYLRTGARDRWAKLRESLDPEERSLLLLRIERRLPWKEVVAVMADEGTPAAEAALRKRFERLRVKLRQLFKEHGLRP